MEKILLHSCCAPCACYPLRELLSQGYQVTLFYYNPNIHPFEEYRARLAELKNYLAKLGNLELIEGDYEVEKWFKLIKGLEHEPERGKRCDICYRMRLERTAQLAKQKKFDYFGSTLSISPHKKADVISRLGEELAAKYQIKFFDRDWKKKDGFKISCQISREENFYRQDYCGCIFSKLAREKAKQLSA